MARQFTGRSPVATATVAAVALALMLTAASNAHADDSPYGPANDEPPVEIDANSPKLMMRDGATLAQSRVIDIVQVVEEGGVREASDTPSGTPAPGTPAPDRTPEPSEEPVDRGGSGVAAERREESNEKTKFTLQAEVLFPKGAAKLNSRATARIAEIAEEINRQKASEVSVYGFTDDIGSYASGTRLSQERAEVVHKELLKTLDDSSLTFDIRGYSEDYPIASNATEEGRAQNRRVEISFTRAD